MQGVALCLKELSLLARSGIRKISSVSHGVTPIKNDYSDYPKSFIKRLNGPRRDETCFVGLRQIKT